MIQVYHGMIYCKSKRMRWNWYSRVFFQPTSELLKLILELLNILHSASFYLEKCHNLATTTLLLFHSLSFFALSLMCQSSRWWAWLNIKVTSTLVTFLLSLSLACSPHPLFVPSVMRSGCIIYAMQSTPSTFFLTQRKSGTNTLCTDGEAGAHTHIQTVHTCQAPCDAKL